jgi:hypothetical protein
MEKTTGENPTKQIAHPQKAPFAKYAQGKRVRNDTIFSFGKRLEEAAADAIGQFSEINDGEEIDGFEFAIDGGRSADAA